MTQTKEVIKVKQLIFDADKIEALTKSMLNRTMRELTAKEYINIIQVLQSGTPLEEDKK